jgi:hypothetical protein
MPELGLPEPSTPQIEPYHANLSLEGVAQPVVGVGVSRFGTSFGGGLALTFGDTLGNHVLATAIQINSNIGGSTSVKDIGAQVAYLNMKNRWKWGLVGGQIPYLSSAVSKARSAAFPTAISCSPISCSSFGRPSGTRQACSPIRSIDRGAWNSRPASATSPSIKS